MKKHRTELKLQIAKMVVEQGYAIKAISREQGISIKRVKHWSRVYRYHGTEGLINKVSRKYATEEKLDMVKCILDKEISIYEAAARYNVDRQTIRKWLKRFKEHGEIPVMKDAKSIKKKPNKKSTRSSKTMEELIEENRLLKIENEYLKKLDALLQEKKKSAKKTK